MKPHIKKKASKITYKSHRKAERLLREEAKESDGSITRYIPARVFPQNKQ